MRGWCKTAAGSMLILVGLAACGGNQQLYPGPERPGSELAHIQTQKFGDDIKLYAIDGQRCPKYVASVLPGLHELTLDGPLRVTSAKSAEDYTSQEDDRPRVSTELELEAGKVYLLGVELRDPAFGRARHDGDMYYEESYYRAWELVIFVKAFKDGGVPERLRSIRFEAE